MAQADFIAAENGTGEEVLISLNELAAAGITNNSGSTPPPDPQPGMPWHFWRDPEWGKAVRSRDNSMWFFVETYGLAEEPGATRNEAAGYPIGAKASTQTNGVFWHTGNGVWQQLGSGGGSSGAAGGGGVFFAYPRLVRSDDQIPLGLNMAGQTRLKRE